MGRACEDLIDSAPVGTVGISRRGPVEGEIAGRFRPDLRARDGLVGVDYRRQRLIIDDDLIGGVLRRRRGRCNHQGHRLADMHDAVRGERGAERRDRL